MDKLHAFGIPFCWTMFGYAATIIYYSLVGVIEVNLFVNVANLIVQAVIGTILVWQEVEE